MNDEDNYYKQALNDYLQEPKSPRDPDDYDEDEAMEEVIENMRNAILENNEDGCYVADYKGDKKEVNDDCVYEMPTDDELSGRDLFSAREATKYLENYSGKRLTDGYWYEDEAKNNDLALLILKHFGATPFIKDVENNG